MQSAFKAYDIRGEIPQQMNVPFAYRFGQAVAHDKRPASVVVGHDMRQDSPALAQAIAQGLLDSGVDVLPLGQCGTEEVYFQTDVSGADAGLMVTASHNPYSYNGIKMVLAGARAATRDNALQSLETLVYSDRKFPAVSDFAQRGRLAPMLSKDRYVERLLSQVEGIDLKPLKIVCHAGNGCAGPVIDLLEAHLPFEFIKVDHEPDRRVGTMDCSIAPLTEPDMRTTHPALWIGPSKCQLKLGRYLRGVKFLPSGLQRYQSSCEPGNRIGPRHARTVGLVPDTPAAIRGAGGSPAARPHCQKMPEKEAGSLLLTHDDRSQPTADMGVEYTQSLDTLFRAKPEVRHPPVEVAAETRHTR